MIIKAKRQYYQSELIEGDRRKCFKIINTLLKTAGRNLPDNNNTQELCDSFASFFPERIDVIRGKITVQLATEQSDNYDWSNGDTIVQRLSHLRPVTEEELTKIISDCPPKTCCLDPCPTDVLQKTLPVHVLHLLAMVNNSFNQGQFPKELQMRQAVVKPLLKKNNLDTNVLKNYRPVSNIPFQSKILEKCG